MMPPEGIFLQPHLAKRGLATGVQKARMGTGGPGLFSMMSELVLDLPITARCTWATCHKSHGPQLYRQKPKADSILDHSNYSSNDVL